MKIEIRANLDSREAIEESEGVEYFRRKLHNALRVPNHFLNPPSGQKDNDE